MSGFSLVRGVSSSNRFRPAVGSSVATMVGALDAVSSNAKRAESSIESPGGATGGPLRLSCGSSKGFYGSVTGRGVLSCGSLRVGELTATVGSEPRGFG